MKDVTRADLLKARKKITDQQCWLDALVSPTSSFTDVQKVHAIIAIAKTLDDPAVSEGALYASNVLNGKGNYLRRVAKDKFADGNFGILPKFVAVVG